MFEACAADANISCLSHSRLSLVVFFFPVWNRMPQKGERGGPPGLFSEDADRPGHIWAAAGVPGPGWIFPDEAAQLEPRGREAGQCLQVAEPQVERSLEHRGVLGGRQGGSPPPVALQPPPCVSSGHGTAQPRVGAESGTAWVSQGAGALHRVRGNCSCLPKPAPAAAPPLSRTYFRPNTYFCSAVRTHPARVTLQSH